MSNRRQRAGFTVQPFTHARRQQIDWLDLMQRRHTIHILMEVDVTHARRSLKAERPGGPGRVSFTAFLVWCVAQAVYAHKELHACRQGSGRLVVFDDVDITVLIERQVEGQRIPVPCIVRAANRKPPAEIHGEIRAAQAQAAPQQQVVRWLPLWLSLPAFLRRLFWTVMLGNPQWRKQTMGTVSVTAVGMFGRGPAWGIPQSAYALSVTAGGIAHKPGLPGSQAEPSSAQLELRQYLSLTLSVDHDVVDGAPAARFAEHLRQLLEAGAPT